MYGGIFMCWVKWKKTTSRIQVKENGGF
jgi:hypothetical protein